MQISESAITPITQGLHFHHMEPLFMCTNGDNIGLVLSEQVLCTNLL